MNGFSEEVGRKNVILQESIEPKFHKDRYSGEDWLKDWQMNYLLTSNKNENEFSIFNINLVCIKLN